jgi:hypothetical protein
MFHDRILALLSNIPISTIRLSCTHCSISWTFKVDNSASAQDFHAMSSPTVITTPHNQDGISVFGKNLAVKSLNPRVGLIYSTSSNGKVDLTNDKEHAAHDPSALIPEEGSAVMVAEWPPGSEPRMHRTLTVDMGVMTAGESVFHL